MFYSISLLFLGKLSTFSISPHALAFLTFATLISVVRAFFEQFLHFLFVKVGGLHLFLVVDLLLDSFIENDDGFCFQNVHKNPYYMVNGIIFLEASNSLEKLMLQNSRRCENKI